MPLYLTQSHSSRVSKTANTPASLRRSVSSPLANAKRTKSFARQQSFSSALNQEIDSDEESVDRLLSGAGKVVPTFNATKARDVTSAIQYATQSMFSDIPERAGMNSVRIAEVLNLHKGLPPIVSLAHVHAIISASSRTERDIQGSMAAGRLRKLKVSGRGSDIDGLNEVLILTTDYEDLIEKSGLPATVVSGFLKVLREKPRVSSIPARDMLPSHSTLLARSGFLVSPPLSSSRNTSLSGSALVAIPTVSRAASGTTAAIGGDAAFEQLGGFGSARRSVSESYASIKTSELILSVPNIGPYLRLLEAGRSHFLELLRTSKYHQAPLYLLREKWDGAVDSDNRISSAKRLRGEFSNILPATTKKWKKLSGLNFDWALEECLGAGWIELFETHSVGFGVRSVV